MDSDQLRRVESIYHAALAREPEERPDFIEEACAGDEPLRAEVESLLAHGETDFLDEPAVRVRGGPVTGGTLLEPGRQINSYRIVSLLGRGGMGEVYRARDLELGREVAIKVLPERFASDTDLAARFEREARLLAAINHPNIAAIYGVERTGSVRFLVLELVEGDTLADLLRAGPMPVRDSLEVAHQIAEGLEAAHEKGVIHRDLKPANIKVTPDGRVKVLDFGLGKVFSGDESQADGASLEQSVTRQGTIMGTPAYMSPEQARGQKIDKRTDVWAFGCVLYEMLTGRQAFHGDAVGDTLAAVVLSEPPWAEISREVPVGVRLLLRRCLEKDIRRRKQSIADVRAELETPRVEPEAAAQTSHGGHTSWKRIRAVVIPAALLAVSAAVFVVLALWSPAQPVPTTMRFPVALPTNQQPGDFNGGVISVSPDGLSVLVAGQDRLYLRSFDAMDARPVPGTEGAEGGFFSHDGRWIGFFARGSVHKVLVGGGSPQRIGPVPGFPSGGSWGRDDVIVIGAALDGLVTISADVASVQSPLTNPGLAFANERHLSPQILPDGRNVVFLLERDGGSYVAVASLETGDYRPLFPGGVPRYVESGHLVYEDGGDLMAVPFDPVALETTGDPGLVQAGVLSYRWNSSNIPYYAVSDSGTLAYVPGAEAGFRQSTRLVRVDRSGAPIPFGEGVNDHRYPRVHPSGTRIAASLQDDGGRNIYLYDVQHPTAEPFTSEGINYISTWWTSQGERLIYQGLFWKALDGVVSQKLPVETNLGWPGSVSRDGRYLAYADVRAGSNGDIWILDLDSADPPTAFADGPEDQRAPWFSPDGRAIAYVTGSSPGTMEVYVAPFPGPGRPIKVSDAGGSEPVWGQTGELFYWRGNEFFTADVQTTPDLRVRGERALFENDSFVRAGQSMPNYDVFPDGMGFIMVQRVREGRADQLNIILDWQEELNERVPVP